jgi:hypothetical protein
MRARLLIATGAVAAASAILAGMAASPAPAAGTCFGAAARDIVHPCVNTSRTITPTLANIDKVTESPCAYRVERGLVLCTFGVAAPKAKAHIALIGDSHAWHWRGAVDYVAHAKKWLGYSITGPGCSFSDAVAYLPEGLRAPCVAFYAKTKAWLAHHPDVSTVFVSQLNSTPEDPPPGQTAFGLRVAGFEHAWTASLPKTVKHVIVIRDVPAPSTTTLECIKSALPAGVQAAAATCSTPRATALTEDVGGAAVQALHAKRYGFIDMSQYFCDALACLPVVGGVLVYRDDEGHITPAFSASLGPYLLRKVQILMVSW